MGNLSGSYFQNLTERVSIVANSDTWIEGKAIQQLEKTAQLDGVVKAVGMPDLHPGRGYPIGAVFASQNKIYPALVGNDIGCGMSLWGTQLKTSKIKLDKIEKQISNIDAPLDEDWQKSINEKLADKNLSSSSFDRALGTIGGGNHFAELQKITEIIDKRAFESTKINEKMLLLIVHSGSRGLGESILRNHVMRFGHDGLKIDSQEYYQYLEHHDQALKFAEINRELIAKRLMARLRTKGNLILDVNHNLVSAKKIAGENYFFHRKGATPADQGIVIIPGSRGDYSYLVLPSSNDDDLIKSLFSLAHGAGRKWMRSECKARLSQRYKKEDLQQTSFGSRVICNNKELLYEEAPEAYKSISSVIEAMVDAKLISVVAKLQPVLTYKTQGGNR